MPRIDAETLPPPKSIDRHAAFGAAYCNAGLWAIGNGLASSTLLVYLVLSLGAKGLAISLIIAAPRLIGLLRLATPELIGRLGSRRWFCLLAYSASAFVLLGLPAMALPAARAHGPVSISLIVAIWSLYHLLEYLGTVSLWSWLGDLAPQRIRGRFIGRRERWLTLGLLLGLLLSAGINQLWKLAQPQAERQGIEWVGLSIPVALGALMMMLAVAPLYFMPNVPARADRRSGVPITALLAPLKDARYLRLLAFGCWFSFFNGVTQAPQYMLPKRVLGLSLSVMLGLIFIMRVGQSLSSAPLGRLVDRFGSRPVMIFAQLQVATGPLFYLFATQGAWQWIVFAWLAWIAYAGLNVALPSLMLKLSPGDDSSPYIATYFAITGLAYGLSTILGGWLFERAEDWEIAWNVGAGQIDRYELFFIVGWLTRSAGVLWLCWIIEPGAKPLRQLFRPNN